MTTQRKAVMPSPYTTAGFYHAPVSKALVGSSIIFYFLVTFPLHRWRGMFVYDTSRIFLLHEIWRLLLAKVVFLDAKDMLLGTLLFYNFRIFERRYGSKKFCSFLLATGLMSTVLVMPLVRLCQLFHLDIIVLPSGPFDLLYPLLVPHFHDLPRVAVAHLWGIPITGKSFTYIVSLQLASGSVESFMVAACGITAGLLHRCNFLNIESLIYVPQCVADFLGSVFGHLFDTPPPRLTEVTQGATLEIQRLQQTERLEQQLMWPQLRNERQPWGFNFPFPRQNIANRGRRVQYTGQYISPQVGHRASRDQAANNSTGTSEEQVSRLCEMGFNRDRVLHALQACNNDITTATTFLLQDS